jgi:hypothetical protein
VPVRNVLLDTSFIVALENKDRGRAFSSGWFHGSSVGKAVTPRSDTVFGVVAFSNGPIRQRQTWDATIVAVTESAFSFPQRWRTRLGM